MFDYLAGKALVRSSLQARSGMGLEAEARSICTNKDCEPSLSFRLLIRRWLIRQPAVRHPAPRLCDDPEGVQGERHRVYRPDCPDRERGTTSSRCSSGAGACSAQARADSMSLRTLVIMSSAYQHLGPLFDAAAFVGGEASEACDLGAEAICCRPERVISQVGVAFGRARVSVARRRPTTSRLKPLDTRCEA